MKLLFTKGITLVETVVYIGLLSILLTGLIQAVYALNIESYDLIDQITKQYETS